jgi:hypothetical protein
VRLLHPYLGYEVLGGFGQLDSEMHAQLAGDTANAYVITILGGSVAQMFGQLGGPRLAELIGADPRFAGKRIVFHEFARGGFKQPQQAEFLAYLLTLGLDTDAVIDIDGFNEVAIGMQNASLGTHPVFPSVPHWAHLVAGGATDPKLLDLIAETRDVQRSIDSTAERALAWNLSWSAVLGDLALGRLALLRRERVALFTKYSRELRSPALRRVVSGPDCPADRADPLAACVRDWEQSSRTIGDMCRGRGLPYLHVLQPTLHDPEGKRPTKAELASGGISKEWLDGVQRGYPLLREAGARLAAGGEHFFDATRVFADVTATIYFDNCHFRERGNQMLAEAIAPAFLAALPEAK